MLSTFRLPAMMPKCIACNAPFKAQAPETPTPWPTTDFCAMVKTGLTGCRPRWRSCRSRVAHSLKPSSLVAVP